MTDQEQAVVATINESYTEKYGFHEKDTYTFKTRKGVDHDVVDQMSDMKGEPDWMREFRHKSLDIFFDKPMTDWVGTYSRLILMTSTTILNPQMKVPEIGMMCLMK